MPQLLSTPTIVPAAGEPPKEIAEFVGNASSGDDAFSVARMRTTGGWVEPGQTAQFDEVTYVISGEVKVEHGDGSLRVGTGEAVLVRAGEWVRYSTPDAAEYIALCVPAFALPRVARDAG
jgi:mannose-6-phosphate isomerase-like protein (cupin superfamily)